SALGRLGAIERRVVRRRPWKAGDQRRLTHRQLGDGLAEVCPGRGLDAIRALAEIDLVQVHLEDAVLRVPTLELEGEYGLFQLPLDAFVRSEKEHLGELLGDGASTLDDPPAPVVLKDCPGHADRIDPPLRVERQILW